MSDTEMGLDVADTLCFQLGGVRRRMTWRQFILALGLHTDEEMAEAGFGAYWLGSERAPKKVTGVDLFYLWSMDRGTANVPYLLAQYLFKHVEGRKSGARLSRGHFIGCLAAHFGLVSDQGLRGLSMVTRKLSLIDLHELGRLNIYVSVGDTWAWVAPRSERQPDVAASALRVAEDAHAVDEGAQAGPAPCQHLNHHHLTPGLCHRGLPDSRRRCRSCDGALWGCDEMLTDQSLIRAGLPPGWPVA
ncbi:hypothetical protein Tco_0845841 [Tanacetum coccineum]